MTFPSLRAVVAFALLAALMGSPAAAAQRSRSDRLNVSARVTRKCAVATTPLRFGDGSEPANAQPGDEAVGTVAFDCTRGIRAELALDPGQNALNGRRRLASTSGSYLEYELYQDSPLTRPWVAGSKVSVYVIAPPENDDSTPEAPGPFAARAVPPGRGYRSAARFPALAQVGGVGPVFTSASMLVASLMAPLAYEPAVAPGLPAVSVAPPFAVGIVVYGRVAGRRSQGPGDFRDVVRATVVF